MEKRKLNVSGYRGIWGESLTKEITENFVKAFGTLIKETSLSSETPTILIGRDGRESGPEIKKIIITTLENLGIKAIDGDIMPTPTVLFSVRKHKYDGGIIITASHNPIEYNGLKFVNKEGFFATKEEIEKINRLYENINSTEKTESAQNSSSILEVSEKTEIKAPDFPKEHVDAIVAKINTEKIKEKKFKVAVDMINASACVMNSYLFEQLGVELIPINNIPNGKFAHKPEPLKENLEEVGKIVKQSGADLGFAHDPDADRLVMINEFGEVVLEEYTLAFGVENILSKNPNQNIVINLSTSRMSEDIAEKYNSKCFRAKVGEANVVEEMQKKNAIIGGEGNGGTIFPTINFCRDSFVSIALILELLAERNQTVTECINSLPKYFIKKDKMPANRDLNEMFTKLKEHFPDAKTNEEDGLYLSFPDKSWVHLRASNTEPIIRLIGEAATEERIVSLFNDIKLTLGL